MKKNSTTYNYDPKLPDDQYLQKQSGQSDVPKEAAKEPGNISPNRQDLHNQENQDELTRKDDEIRKTGEAALTTNGEEMRPKDGSLDGGTAR